MCIRDSLQQEIPDVVLMNKAAQQTVEQMHQYVKNYPSVYLSSHDWNAPNLLDKATPVVI